MYEAYTEVEQTKEQIWFKKPDEKIEAHKRAHQ